MRATAEAQPDAPGALDGLRALAWLAAFGLAVPLTGAAAALLVGLAR